MNEIKIIANIIGVFAVALFVLSYQLKTRKGIVLCNAISRALYVLQYLLLYAFEGAVLDIVGILASILAQNKDKGFIKKYLKTVIIGINLIIVITGILLYKNIFSLLPMLGVLFHTGAFWLTNEKHIRRISFLGSPFWFVYNIISGAFGSAMGDMMTMVSISLAMYRYDFKKKNDTKQKAAKQDEMV